MNALNVSITTSELDATTKDAMWALYQPFYYYSKGSFMKRFERHTHYALYYRNDRLVGFTGLRIEKIATESIPSMTIYFGQTIVAPGARGRGLIVRTGLVLLQQYWKDLLQAKV